MRVAERVLDSTHSLDLDRPSPRESEAQILRLQLFEIMLGRAPRKAFGGAEMRSSNELANDKVVSG